MEHYETEEQQVEAIKRFWKEYGMSIIAGAAGGLAILGGWNYFQQSQVTAQENASVAYEEVLNKADNGDELATAVANLNGEHSDSSYASLAALLQARSAVDQGDYAKAEQLLNSAIAQLDDSTKPLAQLRLARVQQAQANLDGALATVAAISNDAFAAQRDELKGDLLVAKGDINGARSAYQAALEASEQRGNPVLQIKIDELAQAS